jgi:hypothetical protein
VIPLIAIALVLATALIVFAARRSRQVQPGDGQVNEISRFRDYQNQEATGDPMPPAHIVNERRKVTTSDLFKETETDNLKFCRDEIRQIVDVRQAERMTDFVRQQFIAGVHAHDDLRAKI